MSHNCQHQILKLHCDILILMILKYKSKYILISMPNGKECEKFNVFK